MKRMFPSFQGISPKPSTRPMIMNSYSTASNITLPYGNRPAVYDTVTKIAAAAEDNIKRDFLCGIVGSEMNCQCGIRADVKSSNINPG
jgi:hypothetical protein